MEVERGRAGKTQYKKEQKETLEVMNVFIILIIVIVSWVYTYVKSYQIGHFK